MAHVFDASGLCVALQRLFHPPKVRLIVDPYEWQGIPDDGELSLACQVLDSSHIIFLADKAGAQHITDKITFTGKMAVIWFLDPDDNVVYLEAAFNQALFPCDVMLALPQYNNLTTWIEEHDLGKAWFEDGFDIARVSIKLPVVIPPLSNFCTETDNLPLSLLYSESAITEILAAGGRKTGIQFRQWT